MNTRVPKLLVLFVCIATLGGCVRWAPVQSYGQVQEVMVKPLGEPYIQTTTQANVFGASRTKQNHRGSTTAAGGAFSSTTESRCVQRAEILYAQPVTTTWQEDKSGGWLLSGGAILLGAGLFIGGLVADWSHEEDEDFARASGDPDFFDPGPEPDTEGVKLAGGALAATGVGVAFMTARSRPDGPRPQDERDERTWTEVVVIDAEGCR